MRIRELTMLAQIFWGFIFTIIGIILMGIFKSKNTISDRGENYEN